ncbi:MAG: N-acetyl-gamma-glutamyl-phosphate reductase [Verrucomicrobia bacterium]|nr:N-acetyl-gamma-glutamyl-phosphate reductase [Verrucomicrobiota bacterium]MBV9671927.1 N-acetyl-gamma-glutamyl-phosphate reductase [Verrucomicrobiota bacterium]
MKPTIFIDGEAGTTGLQIRKKLTDRKDIELLKISASKRKEETERRQLLNEADLAILCLPDHAARKAVVMLTNPRTRILDASTAHRVQTGWVYGFPELVPGQNQRIREAARVSNPGCYSTGALALLRPIIDAGVLPRDYPVCIHGLSGYTGGGRSMIEAFEAKDGTRVDDPVRLYALELDHKHVEEIRLYAGLLHRPLFWPAVGNFPQGMLVQIPIQLRNIAQRVTGKDFHDAYAAHYEGQPFMRVMPFEPRPVEYVSPQALQGTNELELFIFENPVDRHLLLVARLDNLGKGAAGAAIQNLELMLDLKS